MATTDWYLSLKVVDQPKFVFQFPETEPGDVPPGGYRIATLKQLVAAQLSATLPDPDLIEFVHCGRKLKDEQTLDSYGIQSGSTLHILRKTSADPEADAEPVNKASSAREFRLLHAALHSNAVYKDSVFKMLASKESLDQIIMATPGLSSDAVAMGVLQDKDLFMQFIDPAMLDMLAQSHPALVNAVTLVLHFVAGSMPAQASTSSSSSTSRNATASSYSEMPGGFLFEGMSEDEEDFQSGSQAGSSRRTGASSGARPASLAHSGATGPRPITQAELATALALASTPESSAVTPTTGHQSEVSSGGTSRTAGTPVTSDLFSQALQQALQAQPGRWQSQMQQLRDMGIQDEELMLRALQATNGDIQAALELIFAGGAGL
ncbi:hypothetical protein ACEWY4_027677 [Coilia grayii]|uniref:Ubiquitin-like protein 7 n=1 Tax=Coilia grayii TaxID=363190 RepID=A0ABD1IR68_9TELE